MQEHHRIASLFRETKRHFGSHWMTSNLSCPPCVLMLPRRNSYAIRASTSLHFLPFFLSRRLLLLLVLLVLLLSGLLLPLCGFSSCLDPRNLHHMLLKELSHCLILLCITTVCLFLVLGHVLLVLLKLTRFLDSGQPDAISCLERCRAASPDRDSEEWLGIVEIGCCGFWNVFQRQICESC